MFFTDKEKEIMEKLFLAIEKNKEDIYVLTFANGDVVEVTVDTCYETDNGLEEDDVNFEEYYACAMKIVKVINDNNQTFESGKLIEINYHNYPQKIRNSKGEEI